MTVEKPMVFAVRSLGAPGKQGTADRLADRTPLGPGTVLSPSQGMATKKQRASPGLGSQEPALPLHLARPGSRLAPPRNRQRSTGNKKHNADPHSESKETPPEYWKTRRTKSPSRKEGTQVTAEMIHTWCMHQT